ncbi:beta strand repeat-containing protein, partial [Filimonas zeae]|uniref:beta strand repeat-containing protein n=1 Tax=Filimonas zeae TaxID=1737353 RepID=UPI00166D36BC
PEMEKSVGVREVCAGSAVTLTNGSTGGTGVWSSSAVSVATIDNNGIVRGVAAGNAVITYSVTTAKGCVSVDTAHIAVNALPEMEKSIGLREVCAGSSVTLTNGSTGGTGVWSSSAASVATVDNNGLVRGVSAGSAVITYTVTTAKGCVSQDTAHIAVNALPEMEKSVGVREVCAGSAVTLTNGSTGGTGVWSSSAVSVATVDNNGVVRGIAAGNTVITYTVTTAKGCVSVDTAHIAVNALPEMEKSVGLREVCAGSAVTLTNGSTGGTGVWSSSAVGVATVDNNGVVRGVSAGSAVITYTVTTAKGCVSVDTAHVAVNALPEMEKSISLREVCAGSSVTLTNGSTGGTGVWSSSAVSVATVDNNGLVRGVVAGSAVITYSVTTAKGCVSVDTAHIAVNALPEMEKSVGAREVCAGSAVALTNGSTGGTGVWSSSVVSVATVDNNGLVRGIAAGNAVITYTVTTGSGCVSVDTAYIAVNALPEMEKSVGAREVCAGSAVTLTNGSTGGTGVWSSSNTGIATIDNNGLVRGVAAGSAVITYTVTTAKGCVSQDTAHIAVNALPEMEKSVGLREVCAGSAVTLTNGSTGGTGVWSSSAASVATIDNNGLVRGVAAGNAVITYTVTTAKGCVSVDTAHIAVNALPEMEKSVGAREVCAGSAVTLTNGSTGGTGVWSSSNTGIATIDNNGLVRGVAAGSAVITYTVTTAKGCVSQDTAHIAVNALPEMEKSVGLREVCAGSAVTLTNGSTGGTGVWSSSAASVATVDNNGLVRGVAAGNAVITYTVTTAKGCVSVDTAHIAVNALPEMEKSAGAREVCAGSTVTLTNSSTGGTGVWSSSNTVVATIDNNGLV